MDDNGDSVVFWVAETGKLRASLARAGPGGPDTWGAGDLANTGGTSVSGAMQAGSIDVVVPSPPTNLGCDLSGDVTERVEMTLSIVCSDDLGIVYDETVSLFYVPEYENDSSLADIAGNYTLFFNPATNTLNVAADGTVFGMYDNGA